MDGRLRSGFVASAVLAMLSALSLPAAAQIGDEIPHPTYYSAVQALYEGDYRVAERELRRESQRGVRTAQSRWIDAICYHAMLGEVLYQQGRNGDALAEYDQACQQLLAYPNFLLRVKFQMPPRPDPIRSRRVPPWGQSERQFVLGQFSNTEQVLVGQLDNSNVARQGGVFSAPMLWRVNIGEVVRTSALAIRRRNELLGPLGPQNQLSKELADVLSRGNLAPPNHWSAAWIDLLRGLAQEGLGRLDEADTLLGRAVIVDGQYDHPLTCVALFEQGRLAMIRGDSRRAGQLFAEASYSAFYFDNWDVLTESLRRGWLNYVATGGAGVYPPLDTAAAWAQSNRQLHMAATLRLAEAESLLWSGQVQQAASLLEETARRLGDMKAALPGIHLLYLQAALQFEQGRFAPGNEAMGQALAAQAAASVRNFQIARCNDLYDGRQATPRVAVKLYAGLLSDPTASEWVYQPLDAMAVLKTPQDAAFDRWLTAALEQKDVPLAFEIAEQTKRRRYLASLAWGGRLAALRMILEAPEDELSRSALLQRQQLIVSFPAYHELAALGNRMFDELRAGPIVAPDANATKSLADRYEAWSKNADQRERIIAQMALRHFSTSSEFPPLRTTPELQKALDEGESLVLFHAAGGNLYGFLLSAADVQVWQLGDVRQLRTTLGALLRAVGNYGANKTLSVEELKNDKWREAATSAYQAVFAEARMDLSKIKSLLIVPDSLLWYLPFETLIPPAGAAPRVLADRVPIRYGPTAALAVGDDRPLRRPIHTGIVANQLAENADVGGPDAVQELEKVVPGPVRLAVPLPEPGYLLAPLLDWLVALDDIETSHDSALGWSPFPHGRDKTGDTLDTWFALPFGGPERVVLTGLATEAEQGLKSSRRGAARSIEPGSEMFQSICGLMANGARTILMTRWRTGGQTNVDLVREFVQELPNGPASQAWQRSCLLARESRLDAQSEPRLKRKTDEEELPTADHPFFWAGYLLVDTSPMPPQEKKKNEDAAPAKKDAPKGQPMPLPPPDKGDTPPGKTVPGRTASPTTATSSNTNNPANKPNTAAIDAK